MTQSRRQFISAAAGLGAGSLSFAAAKDDISLAAWSIVQSFRNARWKNLELPRLCREQFRVNGLEFVNQFFENPTINYLQELKRNGASNGITFVRIMVDNEGNMAAVDKEERMQSAVAHRKWVDIAHYLGCRDIRCNMRGGPADWKQDSGLISRAAESFQNLLEYSKGSGIDIVIENHGGASSDAGVLVALMKAVNNPRFGLLPDFGNVNRGDDRYEVLRKLMPYARGISVKASWSEDGTHPRWDLEKMIGICQEFGYHGFWGIESSFGRSDRQTAADQVWQNEVKGIELTRAVIERVVLKG